MSFLREQQVISQPGTIPTVEVRKINGRLGHRFVPCNMCKWKNAVHSKGMNKTLLGNSTHAIYARWNSFNRNIMSGQGDGLSSGKYAEVIGQCNMYSPLK